VESGDDMKAEGEAPAIITGHAFVAEGEWWTTCRHCGLAEAAHFASERVTPSSNHGVDHTMREAGER
jgi:hypothetical protein